MTNQDPNEDQTPELFPEISPADEQFLASILGGKGVAGPVPPEVAARWQDQIGKLSRKPSRRPLRLAGAVASIAAVALTAGVVANTLISSTAPSGQDVALSPVTTQRAAPLPIARTVTTSGLVYQPSKISSQLRNLLARVAPPSPAVDQVPIVSADPTISPEQGTAPDLGVTADPSQPQTSMMATSSPDPEAVSTLPAQVLTATTRLFIDSAGVRTKCFLEITGDSARRPVVLDIGQYNGEVAALVAFPTATDAQRLDIWVVRPSCTTGEPQILWFGRVLRP